MKLERKFIPLLATGTILALLFSVAAMLYPGFGSLRVAANLFSDNATLGIVAVGMSFVILAGGIDLSVGAVVAFTTVLVASLVMKAHWHPLAAAALALVIGAAFGWAQGALIRRFEVPAFLITLSGMFLARGMAFVVERESLGITHSFHTAMSEVTLPLGARAHLSLAALLFLGTLAVGVFVAHWTEFGRNLYALGGDADSAQLMGLPVGRLTEQVYALNGFTAALAGVAATLYTGSGNPATGVGLELDAIAAVVVGGTLLSGGVGYVAGTLLGVLIFGTIQTALVFDGRLNSWWLRIVVGLLLLGFILLQRFLTCRTPAKSH